MRHVHHELLAPWADVWWRWSEKWGLRASIIRDLTHESVDSLRLVLVRHSEDHVIRLGFRVSDSGNDLSFVFDIEPAIGGVPTAPPFDPQDEVDFGEFRR